MVEGFHADASSIGLTEDRIQTRVELRLRSAGLTPVSVSTAQLKPFLYVYVKVVSGTFNISVEYKRLVSFIKGDQQYEGIGTMWVTGGTGTHGDKTAYIMNSLDSVLDKFLNEYLKANQQ